MKILTIGIAGGTGSGKTTITKRIVKRFGGDVSVIYYDNYYKARDDVPFEERAKLNYDHPNAFDTELFLRHIRELKSGKSIKCPIYDYAQHNRSKKTVLIHPARVLVIEGILIFADRELCSEMDIKIYVDTDADVRILRRITRDVRDRGRSLKSVIDQYLSTVKPMHEQFVEPSKKNADVIIPEGGHNEAAMSMVMERIRSDLEK